MREKKVKREREREKGEMLFVNWFDQIKLAVRKINCNYNTRIFDYS